MYTVCIDAGHGGNDPGASSGTRQEKSDVLNVALSRYLNDFLTNHGLKVVFTRRTDAYHGPTEKARIANAYGADLLISLHRNSATSNTANGYENWIYSMSGSKVQLASRICQRMAELGFINRGVKTSTSLSVLKHSNMQAVLLELGFIPNSYDNSLFDGKFDDVCRIIAEEILYHFGIAVKEDAPQEVLWGWVKDGSRWKYWLNGTLLKTTWHKIDGIWYYFAGDGYMIASDWVFCSGHWYYLNADGSLYYGWLRYKDRWCYLDKKGAREGMCVTGPYEVDGRWYLFDSDGYMLDDILISPDETGALVVKDGCKCVMAAGEESLMED